MRSDSSVAQACDAGWPALAEVLGSDCANAVFTPRDDCSDGGELGQRRDCRRSAVPARAPAATSATRRPARGGGCSLSAHSGLVAWRAWLLALLDAGVWNRTTPGFGKQKTALSSSCDVGLFRPA